MRRALQTRMLPVGLGKRAISTRPSTGHYFPRSRYLRYLGTVLYLTKTCTVTRALWSTSWDGRPASRRHHSLPYQGKDELFTLPRSGRPQFPNHRILSPGPTNPGLGSYLVLRFQLGQCYWLLIRDRFDAQHCVRTQETGQTGGPCY